MFKASLSQIPLDYGTITPAFMSLELISPLSSNNGSHGWSKACLQPTNSLLLFWSSGLISMWFYGVTKRRKTQLNVTWEEKFGSALLVLQFTW